MRKATVRAGERDKSVMKEISALVRKKPLIRLALQHALAARNPAHAARLCRSPESVIENAMLERSKVTVSIKHLSRIQREVGRNVDWKMLAALGAPKFRLRCINTLRDIYEQSAEGPHPRRMLADSLNALPDERASLIDYIAELIGVQSMEEFALHYKRNKQLFSDFRNRRRARHFWLPDDALVAIQEEVGRSVKPIKLVALGYPERRVDLLPELEKIFARSNVPARDLEAEFLEEFLQFEPAHYEIWDKICLAYGCRPTRAFARRIGVNYITLWECYNERSVKGHMPFVPPRVIETIIRSRGKVAPFDELLLLINPEKRKRARLELEPLYTTAREAILAPPPVAIEPLPECNLSPAQSARLVLTLLGYYSLTELGAAVGTYPQSARGWVLEPHCSGPTPDQLSLLNSSLKLRECLPPNALLALAPPSRRRASFEALRESSRWNSTRREAAERQRLVNRLIYGTFSEDLAGLIVASKSVLSSAAEDLRRFVEHGITRALPTQVLELRALVSRRNVRLSPADCRLLVAPEFRDSLEAQFTVLSWCRTLAEGVVPQALEKMAPDLRRKRVASKGDSLVVKVALGNVTIRKFLGLETAPAKVETSIDAAIE